MVEVDDGLTIGFIFEESLVRTDDLRVFPEPLPDSDTQVDDALNALGGQEGVTKYLLCLCPMRSTRPARWMRRMMAQGKS